MNDKCGVTRVYVFVNENQSINQSIIKSISRSFALVNDSRNPPNFLTRSRDLFVLFVFNRDFTPLFF